MAECPKAFVAGYPVCHSLSPRIHRYWLELYRLKGGYEAVELTRETFPAFVRSLAQQGFCGGNVTLPHKEKAFALAEKCDDTALQVKAVNTLWLEKGVLCGGNTDAYGFARNLDDFVPGWGGHTALVIGAGGASRAVIFVLKQRGYSRIILVNRTRARADSLAEDFGGQIAVADWQSVNKHVGQADLIVNTTALGMKNDGGEGACDMSLPVDFTKARTDTVVADIIYTPLATPFLKQAGKAGLKTVDGIGMLLHQAVPGFERWFGIRPDVTQELRSRVVDSLRNRER